MDCKEFEKLISDFFARKLAYPTLKQFYEHMEKCPDCKEELTIKFLVTEGIQRLDSAGNALRQLHLQGFGDFLQIGDMAEQIFLA